MNSSAPLRCWCPGLHWALGANHTGYPHRGWARLTFTNNWIINNPGDSRLTDKGQEFARKNQGKQTEPPDPVKPTIYEHSFKPSSAEKGFLSGCQVGDEILAYHDGELELSAEIVQHSSEGGTYLLSPSHPDIQDYFPGVITAWGDVFKSTTVAEKTIVNQRTGSNLVVAPRQSQTHKIMGAIEVIGGGIMMVGGGAIAIGGAITLNPLLVGEGVGSAVAGYTVFQAGVETWQHGEPKTPPIMLPLP